MLARCWRLVSAGLFLGVLVALAGQVEAAGAGEIRVGGAPDECYGSFALLKDVIKDELKSVLLVTPSSSTRGLLDLSRGKIDLLTTDETLEGMLADLENKGFPLDPEEYQLQGLGTKTILVYLNRVNRVKELSQEQLSDIFVGRVTNWKQVGGEDREIVVVWGDDTPEQNRTFQKFIVGGKPISKKALWATDERDIIEKVIATPGAIGIAAYAYQSSRTYNPKTPFVSSKVVAVTKGAPSEEIQQVLEIIKSFD